jgi:hypothetical protein
MRACLRRRGSVLLPRLLRPCRLPRARRPPADGRRSGRFIELRQISPGDRRAAVHAGYPTGQNQILTGEHADQEQESQRREGKAAPNRARADWHPQHPPSVGGRNPSDQAPDRARRVLRVELRRELLLQFGARRVPLLDACDRGRTGLQSRRKVLSAQAQPRALVRDEVPVYLAAFGDPFPHRGVESAPPRFRLLSLAHLYPRLVALQSPPFEASYPI